MSILAICVPRTWIRRIDSSPIRALGSLSPISIRSLLRIASERLANIVAPPGCAACDAPIPMGRSFCDACDKTIAHLPIDESTRDEIVACAAYEGAAGRAVRRFKYEERPDLALPIGRMLLGPAHGIDAHLVVPVPLHARKLRSRGYNQAALLASIVARSLGVKLIARALDRSRDTTPQASLGRDARRRNLDGAFRVRDPSAIRGRHVLLVDDVCTTGSTLRACRSALFDAGAAKVTSLVVARANRAVARAPNEPRTNSIHIN